MFFVHSSDFKRTSSEVSDWKIIGIISKFLGCFCFCITSLLLLSYAVSYPPMHLIYDVGPPAGPSSVYVPGKVTELLYVQCNAK